LLPEKSKQQWKLHTPGYARMSVMFGFGKTEIAIRAAFKSVTDGKQGAVGSYHYFGVTTLQNLFDTVKTSLARLTNICRLRSAKQQKETLEDLASGKSDIIIGTHRLVGKRCEIQRLRIPCYRRRAEIRVSIKEKLKKSKVNVDTLTLTATPIPRTLQFSLLGARDLAVINTPPPNRHPINTESHTYSDDLPIRRSYYV
jgi:transcription-repair coupling factor (superfamily II helicase)